MRAHDRLGCPENPAAVSLSRHSRKRGHLFPMEPEITGKALELPGVRALLLCCALCGAAAMPAVCQINAPSMPSPGGGEQPTGQMVAKAHAALERYQAMLKTAEANGDVKSEGVALYTIGVIYQFEGDNTTALSYLERALKIAQAVGYKQGEPLVLLSMGGAKRMLSREQEALEDLNRALADFRALGNRQGESNALDLLAMVYFDLGQNDKCLEYFNQALAMMAANGDNVSRLPALNNLGRVYSAMGQDDKALEVLNEAMPLAQQSGNRFMEGRVEKNLGVAYRDKGDAPHAFDAYGKALVIMNDLGDRVGASMTLDEMGSMHAKLGESRQAHDSYLSALAMATEAAMPLLVAWVDADLMHLEQNAHQDVAIYYGKQAVNSVQEVRGEIQGLDRDLQKSFLSSKEEIYHELAKLLIDQGRLPEAQQVLDLLKEVEYKDYVRGEANDVLKPLTLTPAEQKAEEDYQQSTAELVRVEQRWTELKNMPQRTTQQESELQTLQEQVKNANSGLNAYYSRIYSLFGSESGNNLLKSIKDNSVLLNQAIARSPHTLALYTAVAQDRLNVIVMSGTGPAVGRKYEISEKDLNEKIAALQQALRSPRSDPRPAAQDLYGILIGPIKKDLDLAQAQTLLWSLDGALRYVPIAALYDGRHYLVERYNIVTFTPASFPNLQSTPDLKNMSAVAMGISRKYQDGLNPLPTVVSELDDVVKDPKVQGARGVLPGTILLNGQFTEKAMEDELGGQHAVVHIASHFVLEPGDDSQSYLLLAGKDTEGSGYHLTVADFRDDPSIDLSKTELLTLSACETGVNSLANNGREVDGLAATAQDKGAKAVLSTLWPVDDSSTGELMADFYKRWASGDGKVGKGEALRQAQLDLLLGKGKAGAGTADRGLSTDTAQPAPAAGDLSHPYYWAPFVLAGNWK
jgi:CHAT domain-containing protein/predicted negative regulator of RcsB-dependent stress response